MIFCSKVESLCELNCIECLVTDIPVAQFSIL